MGEEIWRGVVGHEEAYEVSNLGRVRSLARTVRLVAHGKETRRSVPPRILRPGPSRSGHLTVAIGKGNSRQVHALVLEAFVGPCPPRMEGLHLNHMPSDNRIDNLKWGTRSENLKMDFAAGTRSNRGEQSAAAKLTAAKVREIRAARLQHVSYKKLAEEYGVSPGCIWHAANRLNWKHVK